jgi:hypothetical protein
MASFFSGIGRALRAPGLGDRLQAALAAAAGDTGAIQRLRALQLQQAQLQRQNDARDAQVMGAKNLGFSNDEIGALSPEDLSWAARRRIAAGKFDPGGGADGAEDGDVGQAPADYSGLDQSAPDGLKLPGKMGGVFDPKFMDDAVQRMPYKGSLPLFGQGAPPGFDGPAGGATPALPRASTLGHVHALPKGAAFVAPDGSIRRKI